MQIDTNIVAAASDRIDRAYGSRLTTSAPAVARGAPRSERLARVAHYINENRAPDDIAALERAFGTNDLLSIYYLWAGLRTARSVGRIAIAPGPGDKGGYATGFMIAPGLLLTNRHVFQVQEIASRARVQFAYESDASGNERIPTWFSFKPGRFFLNNEQLDYCIVAVDPDSKQGPETLESFGWLRLNPQLGKTDYGQFLSIIQHAGGETKQIAIRENKLLPFEDADDFLTYQSDTFRGSSGSPVCNDLWDVVALHHSGKPLKDAQGHYIGHDGQPIMDHKPLEHEIKWIANEGARTSRIVSDVLNRATAGEERRSIEAAFKGDLVPQVQPLEIDLKTGQAVGSTTASQAASAAGLSVAQVAGNFPASERGFTLTLPLNVSLRVESIPVPSPSNTTSAAPAPATPATIAPPGKDEFLFEKLNFDTDYSDRDGYDENFLGRERKAAMPTIDPGSADQIAPTKKRGKILHYHHFSLMMHAKRRMPVLAAWNTDYSKGERKIKGRETFGKDEWIIDNRMDDKFQLPRGFYDRWKKLDYGHLVRRDDNCWGASKTEIEFANSDTFHLTNCTPQHETFNRDKFGFHGLWGRLENHIAGQASRDRALARLTVLAGPIFGRKDLKLKDEEVGDVYVPVAFWKVVVAPTSRGGIRAFGFITSQEQDLEDEPPFEEFTPAGFTDEQATLSEIEKKTIVRFDDELKEIDTMRNHPSGKELMTIGSENEIWLGRR